MIILLPFCYLPTTGEKKLGTVITPDTWKDGARNTTGIVPYSEIATGSITYGHCFSVSLLAK